jgi:predicted nucleic acid-binding protein
MAIFVDTNILIYALKPQSTLNAWALQTLADYNVGGAVLIDPIVYAELAVGYESVPKLEQSLACFDIKLSPPSRDALFGAARAFKVYKSRGGTKMNVLPDFLIGANASDRGLALITRDTARYASYFPALQLIAPPP